MLHALAKCLHHSGILRLSRFWPNRHFFVLNFHRVTDAPSSFHDGLIEVSPRDFQAHLEWIGRRAEFVSECQVRNLARGGKPKILLTFDDGYHDSHDVIMPILERLGIPGIFFVTPGMLDNRILGPWDRIAFLVKKFTGKSFRFRGREFSLAQGARSVYLALGQWSLSGLPDRSEEFVSELATTLGVELPTVKQMSAELLTWDQVRRLRDRGFRIGGHGFSHHMLSTLTLDQQAEEIFQSKARLNQEGFKPVSFAFPFGSPETYSWETREAALAAGFEYVFSFSGIVPTIRRLDPTHIDRVAFKSSLAKYNLLLSLPRAHNLLQRIRDRRGYL